MLNESVILVVSTLIKNYTLILRFLKKNFYGNLFQNTHGVHEINGVHEENS